MAEPIRWGILGAANIAAEAVIPAIHKSRNGVVAAVGSRDIAKGRAFAEANGIPKAYGSYEDLLADPNIDAIYNPLPNHLHAPWSMLAADAGKPVLCEKPLTVTAQEAHAMTDHFAAKGLPVAEGHMYRFHPQTRRVLQMVRDGAVGDVKHIVSAFCVRLPWPDNVRFVKAYGGGCLYDLGFYSLDIMRQIAGEPLSMSAYGRLNADGADISASGTLGFANGVTGTFACDFESYFTQTYDVIGTEGRIHVGVGFRIEADAATTIQHWQGNWWEGGRYEEITIPPADEYVLMVEDFADAILTGRAPQYPISDAVRGMETLEQLVQMAAANPLP